MNITGLPASQPDTVWLFGCMNGRAGHYAFPEVAPGRPSRMLPPAKKELADWMASLDGRLHDESTNRWFTHWFEARDGSQMTFIARRYRGIDSRPGSWLGFLMPGNSPIHTALRVANDAFPMHSVWELEQETAREQ